MPVVAWAGAAVALAAVLPGSVAEVEPSPAAQTALEAITSPSVPQPLPGSTTVDDQVYQVEGDCNRAIEQYLGPDAPVPAGAVVEQHGQAVVVDLPYARSGVFFESGEGYCQYRIVNAPTVRIVSTLDGLPTGDLFASVLCSEQSETTELAVMTELTIDGVDSALVITAEGAGAVPGSISAIVTSGQRPPLAFGVEVISPDLTQFEFEITGPAGSAHVSGACTGSVYRYLFAP